MKDKSLKSHGEAIAIVKGLVLNHDWNLKCLFIKLIKIVTPLKR